nr:LpqB family beta-propeller domain-containing protein [Amycolatopsis antarctica]
MHRPRRGGLLAALAALVLLAGCATVPAESAPTAIDDNRLGQVSPDVPQPAKDLDPLSVVRDFVHASAQSVAQNEAARLYLDDAARASWNPTRTITIIEDIFGTNQATGPEQSADPNERVVYLRGFHVGRLDPDGAFIASKDPYEMPMRVRKQADGQWRIVDPPNNIVVAESDFNANFVRVPLYFFVPESNALVPDLRYVQAKPQAGLPGRVVALLLRGPSDGLNGAVRNPLGGSAALDTNVAPAADGAVEVPLTGVGGLSENDRRLIAAQVVKSLQPVVSSRIRLRSDGSPLVPAQLDWRPSDLPSYDAPSAPSSELPGLVTVDGRIRSLGNGAPVPGPAGTGAYDVVSAAQSIDGKRLAVVERTEGGMRLRVGDYGRDAPVVDPSAGTFTRPSWRPALSTTGTSGELWTVADGTKVVRVQPNPEGRWLPQAVNANEIVALGPITALRLSRDGARVALIAGEQLVVASVVREADSVTLRFPRILQGGDLSGVLDVDWASQDTLVAATNSATPVVRVPIDGLRMDKFNSSNLTPPVRAITAAPSRSIVVADAGGMWTASDVGEVWRPHQHTQGPGAEPFYPG